MSTSSTAWSSSGRPGCWPPLCRFFDIYVVDGLVRLVAFVPRLVGRDALRPFQNGLIQSYAAVTALGVALLLLVLLFIGDPRQAAPTRPRTDPIRSEKEPAMATLLVITVLLPLLGGLGCCSRRGSTTRRPGWSPWGRPWRPWACPGLVAAFQVGEAGPQFAYRGGRRPPRPALGCASAAARASGSRWGSTA